MRPLSLLLFLIFTLILLNCSCKKDPVLHPETVTVNGQTFGCRIDNVPFIADHWDFGSGVPPVDIAFSRTTFGGVTLIVTANKQNDYVQLFLNKPLVKGILQLNENTQPFPVYSPPKNNGIYKIKSLSPNGEYITSNTSIGFVNLIEIDTINLKVNAVFEFIGTDKMNGKKIKITNGMFKNF